MALPSVGLNTAFSVLTNVLGVRSNPYQACNFMVEIEGILAGSFSECSGLQVETEYFDYREGGRNDYVHHFAGPTKYPMLTFKHGITHRRPLELAPGCDAWHHQAQERTIYLLLDRMRTPVMFWNFKEEPFSSSTPVRSSAPTPPQWHSKASRLRTVA